MIVTLIINSISIKLLTIVEFIVITQGIVFGFLIFNGRKKNPHLLYLGLAVLTFSLDFLPDLLENLGLLNNYPSLLLLPISFTGLTSPLLYTYVISIPELKTPKINYNYLKIGLLFTCIDFVIFIFPSDIKIQMNSFITYNILTSLELFYSILILFLTYNVLKKKKEEHKDSFFKIEFGEVRWAFRFITILLYSLIALLVFSFSAFILSFSYCFKSDLMTLIVNFIDLTFQYSLIIYGLKHKYFQSLHRNFFINNSKNQNKVINEDEKEELIKTIALLDHYLTNSRDFKKNNFSITDASLAINIHTKKISKALNIIKKQNFNSYINQLRIEESIKLLEYNATQEYTIEGIGNIVGFNSKSVFYKEFKKNTGMTPLEYFQRNLKTLVH